MSNRSRLSFERLFDASVLGGEEPGEPQEPTMASVHVYDWGDPLAARGCVQLSLGLTANAIAEVMGGGLPISLLCDEPLARAVAAYILELGGSVDVTPEPSLGVRLLARLSPRHA